METPYRGFQVIVVAEEELFLVLELAALIALDILFQQIGDQEIGFLISVVIDCNFHMILKYNLPARCAFSVWK